MLEQAYHALMKEAKKDMVDQAVLDQAKQEEAKLDQTNLDATLLCICAGRKCVCNLNHEHPKTSMDR